MNVLILQARRKKQEELEKAKQEEIQRKQQVIITFSFLPIAIRTRIKIVRVLFFSYIYLLYGICYVL